MPLIGQVAGTVKIETEPYRKVVDLHLPRTTNASTRGQSSSNFN